MILKPISGFHLFTVTIAGQTGYKFCSFGRAKNAIHIWLNDDEHY